MANPPEDILSIFSRTGAYLSGHFRLTSGLHSAGYLQCALVLQYPEFAERFGVDLGGRLRQLANQLPISVVAAPAIGGLIIGHEVARALQARFIFAERDGSGQMTLRRGFHIEPGENAVVIEDVVTTGGSSVEVIKLLRESSANVIGAGCIIDRSGGQADLGLARVALATLSVATYPEESCPMCKQGTVAQKPGSRPT